MTPVREPLTLALPKGRILRQAAGLLATAGVDPSVALEGSRKLLHELPGGDRLLLVKPVDVPTYVEHGIADVGLAGRDPLLEHQRDLYEPLDLGIGRCRLVVAEPAAAPATLRRGMTLRVATKYPRLALAHYLRRGIQPEIIYLSGSVELGAVTQLADQIVDLVESGATLRENGLVEVETILPISTHLVVHPASLKLKPERITALIDALRMAVGDARTEVVARG